MALPPLPPNATVAQIAADFTASGYNGAAYATWAKAKIASDPGLTPYQAALVWVLETGLTKSIGSAATATGTVTQQAAQGGTTGLENAAKAANLIPGFGLIFGNVKGLLTRFLKILVGGVIILAGILKLTNTDKTLKQVLPLVGGPAGRLLKV